MTALSAPAGRPRVSAPTPGRRVRPVLLPVLAAAAFAWLGWSRRWMSDDGYITLRVVEQLLAGNGPVSNAGQRVEASTSTAWTYLLAAVGALTPWDLAWVSVVLGLVLSSVGVLLAVAGSCRLVAARWPGRVALPAGVLVVLALPPFWDFATSGLETGLTFGWLGACWWLLVRLAVATAPVPARSAWVAAVLFGAGPLARPDLALPAGVLLLALLAVTRPSRRRAVALLSSAAVLPVGYQVFRAGYYAALVPNTALAKEGASLRLDQGWVYLRDFADPYLLVVPLLALLAGAVAARGRPDGRPSDRVRRRWALAAAAPVVGGLAHGGYMVAVGGDFMHGRLLLPAVFLVLTPVLVLPVGRRGGGLVSGAAVLVVAAWAAVAASALRVPYAGAAQPFGGEHTIADERAFYVRLSGHPHPITVADHPDYVANVNEILAAAGGARSLVLLGEDGQPLALPLRPDSSLDLVVLVANTGLTGRVVPLDVRLEDRLGLSNPIAARLELVTRGRPGHEKGLPWSWVLAEHTAADTPLPPTERAELVQAARRSRACPQLVALQEATEAPLTVRRFLTNIRLAPELTRLRIPDDERLAERRLCGGGPAGT